MKTWGREGEVKVSLLSLQQGCWIMKTYEFSFRSETDTVMPEELVDLIHTPTYHLSYKVTMTINMKHIVYHISSGIHWYTH